MKKEKPLKFSGQLLFWDHKNLNDRIYTKEIAEEIIDQFNKRREETGVFLGEFNYPNELRFSEIDLKNVSHDVEEIHINEEEKSIEGTIRILETPSGEIVKKLLKENIIGLSCRPRGMGNVSEEGKIENFKLLSFDLVPGEDSFANITGIKPLKKVDD